MDCELGPAAPPQALLGSLWHSTGMSVQLWVMSWFLSQEAFVVFLALLWLLLVLLLFRLLLILAKPQVGVSAGAERSPGQQGGGSAGAREHPQGWAGGAQPGRRSRFPAGPWPARASSLGLGTGLPWWALVLCWCR